MAAIVLPFCLVACSASPHSMAAASPKYAHSPAANQAPSPTAAPAAMDSPSSAGSMKKAEEYSISAPAPGAPPPMAPGKPAPPAKPSEGANKAKTAAPENAPAHNLMIIYTGQMTLVTEHNAAAITIDQAIDIIEVLGGHLGSRTDTTVTLKVPSAKFREAMTKIGKLGDVTRQSVNAEDVSAEFNDLEVRLLNLKATRQRLQDFLAKANTITDTLTVERELERVAQEIDRIEGRMRFLRDRATFSQITVTMAPKPAPQPVVAPPVTPPPPPAKRQLLTMPAGWISNLGVDGLLKLNH